MPALAEDEDDDDGWWPGDDDGESGFEPVPQRYDVHEMVRRYTVEFLHQEPNIATPENVLLLLQHLAELTDELVAAQAERAAETPACHDDAICRDLRRWQARLEEYYAFTAAVPDADLQDRNAILWQVTAPLFLGWYGGKTGHEIELVPDGFGPSFDPMVQHPPDIATPFTLANQLLVWQEWEEERFNRLIDDLREGALDVAGLGLDIGMLVALGFGVVVAIQILRKR